MGFGSWFKGATGIDIEKPANNFTAAGIESQINPLQKIGQSEFKANSVGQNLGINKLGSTKTTYPYGKTPTKPTEDPLDSFDLARYLQRQAQGRSATLLSNETTDDQANMSVARRRLMAT